jgi:hypothetical protein
MDLKDKYFKLCYKERIHEFTKIDKFKPSPDGKKARDIYKSLDDFYKEELNISTEELIKLRNYFKKFNELYTKYYNEQRKELFENPNEFLKWYDEQNEQCNYCEITQSELHIIVDKRGKNLTLNNKTKRSKGTLEIERKNAEIGYIFDNCILACPFCNNAKSNLISEEDWRTFFVPAMKNYLKSILNK